MHQVINSQQSDSQAKADLSKQQQSKDSSFVSTLTSRVTTAIKNKIQ